jgi:hypothetical protein
MLPKKFKDDLSGKLNFSSNFYKIIDHASNGSPSSMKRAR